jgi:hypothetical protein
VLYFQVLSIHFRSQQNELCNASFLCGFKSSTLLLLSFAKFFFMKRQLTEGVVQRLFYVAVPNFYRIIFQNQSSHPYNVLSTKDRVRCSQMQKNPNLRNIYWLHPNCIMGKLRKT